MSEKLYLQDHRVATNVRNLNFESSAGVWEISIITSNKANLN